MSFYLYDNALKEKLSNVFDNVVNCSEDKAIDYSQDEETAQVTLPMISFWRLNNNLDTNMYNASAILRGRDIARVNNKATNILNYKELPIVLTYQVDIWSDRRYEVDEILKELLLYFMEEPNLEVEEPNVDYTYSFPMTITELNSDVDVSSFDEKGVLYRQTISLEINNARLLYPNAEKVVKRFALRIVTVNAQGEVFEDANNQFDPTSD